MFQNQFFILLVISRTKLIPSHEGISQVRLLIPSCEVITRVSAPYGYHGSCFEGTRKKEFDFLDSLARVAS